MSARVVAWIGLCLTLAAFAAPPARAQPLTTADITANPALTQPVLSPSGRYVALVSWDGDANSILVHDTQTQETKAIFAGSAREHFGGAYPMWIHWKTDERIVFGVRVLQLNRRGGDADGEIRSFRDGSGVFSVKRDGTDVIKVQAPRSRPGYPGLLLDVLRNDPENILMIFNDSGDVPSVARVNVLTGEAREVMQGHRRAVAYYTDRNGEVIARAVLRGLTGRIMIMQGREPGSDQWTELFRIRRDEIRDFADYEILGATERPGELYVSVRGEAQGAEPTASVHIFDFRTRQLGPVLYRHPTYDVSDVVLSDGGEFVAGCYWADALECDFEDADEQRVYRGLKRFFGPERSLTILGYSDDGQTWLLRASGPQNPGDYYIYNATKRDVQPLGPRFPGLPESRLFETRRIDYTAADGQALMGYLTSPIRPGEAREDPQPPLIVMPHGGPESRDVLGWSPLVQALVTRGYQVFQPDFRGSSGRGRAWAEAGYRQWAGVMQQDVYAGLDHLIAQGLADPAQVCIVGASYGGYVANWAAATEPDRFRCAVSIAGLGDLLDIMRWERREADEDSDTYDYWVKSMGDPRRDADALRAASPINRVADWRTPLLLIHGEDDDIVPVDQSRDLNRALTRAGKPVRFVELPNEDHSDWSSESWTTILAELDTFLGRHLPVGQNARPSDQI